MATFNFFLIDEDSIGVEVFEHEQLTDRFAVSRAIFEHQEDPTQWVAPIYGERVAYHLLSALEAHSNPNPELS